MSDQHDIIKELVGKFGAQKGEFAGEPFVVLQADRIVEAATYLREKQGFDLLSDVTAVDYWPEEAVRFHVVYRFTATQKRTTLNVRVPVPGINPAVPSVEKVYYSANWHEREVFDLFGIRFEGHSDLRRILMPFDWEGHPLRKDYPLGYEEPQYSFNFDEIMARKPRGKE